MRIPSLRSLHYFSVAATCKTLEEASAKLFVTRAALSQQIKKLESSLSIQLFNRTGTTLKLTDEGNILLPYVESGMSQFELGIQELKRNTTKILTVSCPHSICTFLLAPKISAFQILEPQITVHLVPNNMLLSHTDFTADLALRLSDSYSEELEHRDIADCSYVLAYSPLIFSSDEQLLKEIYNVPLLLDDSQDINDALGALCDEAGIDLSKLNITLRVNDSVPVLLNIMMGAGIGLVNKLLIRGQISAGTINYYAGSEISSDLKLAAVAPSNNFKNEKVASFLSWLFSEIN